MRIESFLCLFWRGVEDFDAACEKSRTAPSSGCSSSNPCEWDPVPSFTPRVRPSFSPLPRPRDVLSRTEGPVFSAGPRRTASAKEVGVRAEGEPGPEMGSVAADSASGAGPSGSPPGVADVFRRRPTQAGMPARRFRQLGPPPLFIRVPPSERRSSALRLYSAVSRRHFDTTRGRCPTPAPRAARLFEWAVHGVGESTYSGRLCGKTREGSRSGLRSPKEENRAQNAGSDFESLHLSSFSVFLQTSP